MRPKLITHCWFNKLIFSQFRDIYAIWKSAYLYISIFLLNSISSSLKITNKNKNKNIEYEYAS